MYPDKTGTGKELLIMVAAAMDAADMWFGTVFMVVVGTVNVGIILQIAGKQGFYSIVGISLYTAV